MTADNENGRKIKQFSVKAFRHNQIDKHADKQKGHERKDPDMILEHSKGYPSVFDIDQRQQMIDHRHVSVRRKILHHKIFEKLVKSCHHSTRYLKSWSSPATTADKIKITVSVIKPSPPS